MIRKRPIAKEGGKLNWPSPTHKYLMLKGESGQVNENLNGLIMCERI
jgi:hypothetical protein